MRFPRSDEYWFKNVRGRMRRTLAFNLEDRELVAAPALAWLQAATKSLCCGQESNGATISSRRART